MVDLSRFKKIDVADGVYYINKDGEVWNNRTKKFINLTTRKGTGKKQYYFHWNRKTTSKSLDSLMDMYFPNEIESMNGEIWKSIEGYEGAYEISSFGRIKSLNRYIVQSGRKRFMAGKLLSNKRNNGRGYLNVLLCDGDSNEQKSYYIHILVAKAFVENPNNLKEVNHKDFNKSNNNFENLEWVDRAGNISHYLDNKDSHYLNDGTLVSSVINMYLNNKNIDEISKQTNLDYAQVKYIINIKNVI